MRIFLAVSLVILFLWLQGAQRSINGRNVCETASMSETVVSFLLSPLSLYSWTASTLLRFLVSLPALILGALHQSLLLILAGPWCVAAICVSSLLACFHVGLYLLHMALVVFAMAFLILNRHKNTEKRTHHVSEQNETKAQIQQKRFERSGRRISQQG